ncbi:MAG TPA: CHRD domain-containing protein [Rhizomicrobium sp.]|nr:CHRD domain-containing protein [Rhizomicrobium sp.]
MSRRSPFVLCAALLLATPLSTTVALAAATYEAELDPAPFDATNRADVIESIGNVTATLDGSTLTVKGTFSNFTSPATGGSFRIGLAKGVPGDAIGNLSVEHARQGAFSGTIKLTAAQLAALKREALYIRIDSEKASDGNVQGWLEESGKDHVS